MSTELSIRRRVTALRAGAAFIVSSAATHLRAAEVDFRPVLTFGLFHDGNIAVVGEGNGDDGALITIDLAVDRKTPASTLSFSYRPAYVAYRRSTDLNYLSNALGLGYQRESTASSSFYVNGYASRTDHQGPNLQTQDKAFTFVSRTTITDVIFGVGGTVTAGRRGFVDWQLRSTGSFYEDIKDNPATGVTAKDFNDTYQFGGRTAWRGEVSPRNTLGVGVDFAHFGYQNTPNVNTATVALVGTCQMAEYWELDYVAGLSRVRSDLDSENGFAFDAKVQYVAGRTATFAAGARQAFSPGTGLGGSTKDRGLWGSYTFTPTAKGPSASVIGGYWQREEVPISSATASAVGTSDTESWTITGNAGWRFNRFVGLDGAYTYVKQKPLNDSTNALATNYSSYGLVFRWAINGR